jgi:NTE family protein
MLRKRDGLPFRIIASALLLILAGCAAPKAYLGDPISRALVNEGYRGSRVMPTRQNDELLFVVSLSGGGMRASAMAYGLLEQLAADRIVSGSTSSRLLDQVDVISAVSGGAVPAAYFTLFGDRLFQDFEQRFLNKDFTASVRRGILLDPRNWLRMASSEFFRGDLYAEYFDRRLFRGATFSDLSQRGDRPFLIINATDIGLASRFEFTQDSFDLICTDLTRYPVSRAIAASTLVPALLTPITIENRAGQCGYVLPDWVFQTLATGDHSSREYFRASVLKSRSDASRFGYLHLVDGALSDNLGARALYDALSDGSPWMSWGNPPSHPSRRKLIYVSVNAGDWKSTQVGINRQPPDALQMLRLMGTVPMDRYSAESRVVLNEALIEHAKKEEAELYHIEIELDSLRSDPRLNRLVELPTSFTLSKDDALALRCATRQMLLASSDYQRLMRTLSGTVGSLPTCRE